MPITNTDALDHVKGFRGAFSKDMLSKDGVTLIANLEDYFDGAGTHWVAVYSREKD